MEVKIVENYQEMSRLAAILLAAEVIENPHTILGLATGSTPVGLSQCIRMESWIFQM